MFPHAGHSFQIRLRTEKLLTAPGVHDFCRRTISEVGNMNHGHQDREPPWDVVIVGAGPAGLSAALILGRCCRRVLICDRGTPRSWASHAMHAYLSRDGIPPAEFREIALAELERYTNVTMRDDSVTAAERLPEGGFAVRFESGDRVPCRKLLLATGVLDELPPIPDIEDYFGVSVFPCPYCDGWECRDKPIAVFGEGKRGFEMARAMTAWSSDLLLCTHGRPPSRAQQAALAANGIRVETTRILHLEGTDGRLERIHFEDGRRIERSALFFDTPSHSQSHLAASLGCQFSSSGGVRCGRYEATSVPGVFVAGNILRDVQLSIVAAAEGARAAFGINRALTREDFAWRASGTVHVDHPGPN
jgi:thioredoxin reductase